MVAQTAAFKKAVEDSRKLKAKPNNDELLEVNPHSIFLSFSQVAMALIDNLVIPLALRKLQARYRRRLLQGYTARELRFPGSLPRPLLPSEVLLELVLR